jgi:hypothetical protein
MKKSAFLFLRATYFRWAKKIEEICPELAGAPPVLAVGDAHLENFGTWRDAEGRLVWGINDFDDAAVMPYTFDLVRLCSSAHLGLHMKFSEIAQAVLIGYQEGLKAPNPMLLGRHGAWLRPFIQPSEFAKRRFWKKMKQKFPKCKPPAKLEKRFKDNLPEGAEMIRFGPHIAGGGSLGRPSFVAIAEWRGDWIVREAKALVN